MGFIQYGFIFFKYVLNPPGRQENISNLTAFLLFLLSHSLNEYLQVLTTHMIVGEVFARWPL